jgi:hypothetical protein
MDLIAARSPRPACYLVARVLRALSPSARVAAAVLVTGAAAAPFACAASAPTTFTSGSGGMGAGGAGTGASDTFGDASLCDPTCSADLQKVVSCQVETPCAGDEGCVGGQCVPDPCTAAEAAKSSYGCDYWPLETDIMQDGQGACFAAFVANTWSTPVHLSVSYNGLALDPEKFTRLPQGQGQSLTYAPYDKTKGLGVGEVAILFLSRRTGGPLNDCPAPAAVTFDAAVHGTNKGHAFHLTTDRPVVAYQILPYGGGSSAATSATLLLPTSAWGDNYIAVNPYPKSQILDNTAPSLDIVAKEDDTQITLLPRAAITGGPYVSAALANVPVTYTINQGEVLQITQDEELTGSPIKANKPIGVIGGASCMNIPADVAACDSAQQQLPPIRALGNEYAAVRHRDRGGMSESPPWRIVGAVDGTQLAWTPAPPAGAPTATALGKVDTFTAPGPFVVKSQDKDHPFYLFAYMTGGSEFDGEGDPEWVNVAPTAQYLSSYVFFTDPTYSETSLVVVRRASPQGQFADVTLDCAGALGGWQPLGPYEYTRVDLVTGNFQNVGACANGRHVASSKEPFAVTVWGWGTKVAVPYTQFVSYAYPAGVNVQAINDVSVLPIPK